MEPSHPASGSVRLRLACTSLKVVALSVLTAIFRHPVIVLMLITTSPLAV